MTKLVETEIPDWAEWMAQDDDGDWWAYENEPTADFGHWDHMNGRAVPCGGSGASNPDWRDTLHKLEEK